jgi:hypothetical protein
MRCVGLVKIVVLRVSVRFKTLWNARHQGALGVGPPLLSDSLSLLLFLCFFLGPALLSLSCFSRLFCIVGVVAAAAAALLFFRLPLFLLLLLITIITACVLLGLLLGSLLLLRLSSLLLLCLLLLFLCRLSRFLKLLKPVCTSSTLPGISTKAYRGWANWIEARTSLPPHPQETAHQRQTCRQKLKAS